MKFPRGRKRLTLVVVAAVAVVVVATLGFVLWPRGGTPITSEKALADFRSSTRSGSQRAPAPGATAVPVTPDPSASPAGTGSDPGVAPVESGSGGGNSHAQAGQGGTATPGSLSRVPAAGVYAYSAEGYERVSIGPAEQTRQLASTVTATVRPSGTCWTFTHSLFVEHTEDTTYCIADGGSLTLEGHTKHQKVGVVTATADMGCDPATVVPGSAASGSTWEATCRMETHTPVFTAGTIQRGTTAVVGIEAVDVAGRAVQAWHVRIRRNVSGDLTGFWHEDVWFAHADGLPLRIVRNAELSGPATFREESTFSLRSLEPST